MFWTDSEQQKEQRDHLWIWFGLIPQAIEIVQNAIAADNEGEYKKALKLYSEAAIIYGEVLKIEEDSSRKRLMLDRVEGYMQRTEEIADFLQKLSVLTAMEMVVKVNIKRHWNYIVKH